MIESAELAWILTIVFAVTGIVCAIRCVQPEVGGQPQYIADRVSSGCHFLMSAGMLAMVWPWGMEISLTAQILVFSAAALWFVAALVMRSRVRSCAAHGVVMGRAHQLHHGLLMVAMVWMLALMPMAMDAMMAHESSGSGTSEHAGHHEMGSGMHAGSGLPWWITGINMIFVLYCVALGVWWLSRALDAMRDKGKTPTSVTVAALRASGVDTACHSVMSMGMGVMLFVMY